MAAPDGPWFSLARLFRKWHGPHYFIATTGLVLISVSLLYYAILVRPVVVPPPLHITHYNLDIPGDLRVCAGWTYGISWQFTIDRPVVVAVHRSVLDQYGHTHPGSEQTPVYRVYPTIRTTVENMRFTVPILPAGTYVYAVAFVALDRPAQAEIFRTPFIVQASCLDKPQDRTVSPNEPGRPGLRLTPTLGTEEKRQR